MKCLMLSWRLESVQFSYKIFCITICDWIFVFIPALSICSPSVLHWISNYSLIRSTSYSCSTRSFGFGISPSKHLQDFIKIYRAVIKDIFLAPAERDHSADPNRPDQWEQATAPIRDTALRATGLGTPDDDPPPPTYRQ